METSASFEARSAPLPYPTLGRWVGDLNNKGLLVGALLIYPLLGTLVDLSLLATRSQSISDSAAWLRRVGQALLLGLICPASFVLLTVVLFLWACSYLCLGSQPLLCFTGDHCHVGIEDWRFIKAQAPRVRRQIQHGRFGGRGRGVGRAQDDTCGLYEGGSQGTLRRRKSFASKE